VRIHVDPPSPDTRRERIEKKLFARLAAVEMAERVDAVLPPPRRSRMPYAFAGAALAAAIVAIVLFAVREPGTNEVVASPSRVVTPVGGESRFVIEGVAVIDAKSDTNVEVQHGADGAITLVLARGAVDCDVEPRHGRPPFRVLAGRVEVEVVGTRFTVTKTPSPRVDVARGKVKVTTPEGTTLVEAGESWPAITAEVAPAPVPVEDEPPAAEPEAQPAPVEPKPAPAPKAKPAPAPTATPAAAPQRDIAEESYSIAARVEKSDPKKAAQLYRAIATDSKSLAAGALYGLAQVQLQRLHDANAAIETIDEYNKRFPKGLNAEDMAWLRYQALVALGKRDEARGAAADYLRQFPNGAYADRLRTR
jgi:TolA-binding protein